jgi:RHS repeat-associated protein
VQDIYFTYDAVGNITQINDVSSTTASKLVVFGYDDLHRLTSASTTAATSTAYRQTYSYSSIGNISGLKTNTSATSTYTYAETNYANPHAATSIGGASLTYDNNGNLRSYGSKTYGWDYRNRMASSTEGATNLTFKYDHSNQRILKGDGTATTTYTNQYHNIAGATTTRYIYAGGEVVATITADGISTTTTYTHADHLGSTNAVTDSNGDLTKTLDYYPYGSERINSGSDDQQRTYIGQYFDDDIDLSYLNARYYNGAQGQFLSMDPAYLALGDEKQVKDLSSFNQQIYLTDPQGLNSYAYARDNPITRSDPTGKYFELSAGGTGMGWSGAIGLRFDTTGLNVFASGGSGVGWGGHLIGLSWVPGEEVPHEDQTKTSIGGDFGPIGVSADGDYDSSAVTLRNASPRISFNYGAGIDFYVRRDVSTPIIGGSHGNLVLNGGSTYSTPNYTPSNYYNSSQQFSLTNSNSASSMSWNSVSMSLNAASSAINRGDYTAASGYLNNALKSLKKAE